MKIFVAAAVLVIVAALVWFFFPGMEIDRASKLVPLPAGSTPVAQAVPGPKRDFKAITTVLKDDMSKIPLTLHDPRFVPSHAFMIRSQIQDFLGQHEEYRVLNQACELIIHADQEHSVRGRENQQAQARVYTSPLNDTNADIHNKTRREAVDQQAETAWSVYRTQTDAEVGRLLDSLADKQL